MKQELLEYLVRACSREVLRQLNEGPETIAQMHGGSVVNQNEFYTDKHGTWCGQCGGSANSKVLKNNPLTYAYTCGNERCVNHTYPPNQTAFNAQQTNEGDPAIKGASAPPADGQGTADQPPIPNIKSESLHKMIKKLVDEVINSK